MFAFIFKNKNALNFFKAFCIYLVELKDQILISSSLLL
jgi:hypothetical protein